MLRTIDRTGYSKKKAWCGPSAIATLTGCPLREATELLSRVTGEPYAKLSGVWDEAMSAALHQLGYRMAHNDVGFKRLARRYHNTGGHGVTTLARFLAERSAMEKLTPMLINITDHYVSAHLGWACDNHTDRPVPIGEFPKPGRWVVSSWLVEPLS